MTYPVSTVNTKPSILYASEEYRLESLRLIAEKKIVVKQSGYYIATDAEWDDLFGHLCIQFYDGETKVILFNECIPDYIKHIIIAHCKYRGILCRFVPFGDDKDHLKMYMEMANKSYKKLVNMLMFSSPTDAIIAIGWYSFEGLLRNGRILQKRGLSGKHLKVGGKILTIKDLKGLTGGGLKNMIESLGLPVTDKGKMDEYKAKMYTGLLEKPELFIDYAMADAVSTYDCFFKQLEEVRETERFLGIDDSVLSTADTMKMTMGSLVGASFQKWIYSQSSYSNDVVDFAFKKLGLLDEGQKNIAEVRKNRASVLKKIKVASDIDSDSGEIKRFLKADYAFLAHTQASSEYFARITDTSAVMAATIHGGCCKNNRPDNYLLTYAADPDLSSCYGSKLREQFYPIGLPSILAYKVNAVRPLFKTVYDKYKEQLINGRWTMVVNGDLTFIQDILYSAMVTAEGINKAIFSDDNNNEDEISKIEKDFALLRKQVANSIITSEIYRIAWGAANDNEKKELNNLRVENLIYYTKDNTMDSLDQWIDHVIATDVNDQELEDNRTRKYFPLSLDGFIGKLVDRRGTLKDEMKTLSKNSDKYKELDGKQTVTKLFINTLYGDLASIYFPFGNVVLANNVTASARAGVWMMEKGLGSAMSITDGGFCGLNTVCYIAKGSQLPGLAKLAETSKWSTHRGCSIGQLGGIDWTKVVDKLHDDLTPFKILETDDEETKSIKEDAAKILWKTHTKQLDVEVPKHLDNFWGIYGLEFKYKIECKETTSKRVAYWSKSDYATLKLGYQTSDYDSLYFKVRGKRVKPNDEQGYNAAPTYQLLTNIIEGSDVFPEDCSYDHWYLLKCGKWLLGTPKEDDKKKVWDSLIGKRPGDKMMELRTQRFNNGHFPIDTVEDWEAINNRTGKNHDKVRPYFERNCKAGIKVVHQDMKLNKLGRGTHNKGKSIEPKV